MASVLLQLQGIGEAPESALPSVSSRILQMRACRPDVMVAMYAVPHAAVGQAVRWHLRPGDTFLVKGEWEMWMKKLYARALTAQDRAVPSLNTVTTVAPRPCTADTETARTGVPRRCPR
ncbi:hypothetical protein LdCL_200018500 [Leishmania donovani]|nr:hypothetical protein LdCL_200018500 [Leishmania donovani]